MGYLGEDIQNGVLRHARRAALRTAQKELAKSR